MATVAINNLGTGTGFIYETLQDNTITCVRANTPEGVRDMLQKGAANAPIAANRSAVATITITGVAATGAFTAVTINGVNQIAGNVNVLTSNTSTEAARLAAAINNFTPATGLDYVAEVNANVITLIEPEKGGGISNGWTPTVSASSGTITSNTTDFKDGAPAATVYDVQFGRFYYLNSNIDALADDLTGSIDITKYITVRGTEVGNPTLSLTIASDGLNSVNRYANTTQIKLTNEAAAASDYLVYINSVGFVDGDLLILCAATDSQLTTIVSQPNASTVSSNPNANIYLNNNDSFTTTGILGTNIVLKYSFADSTGGTFTEIARSTKSGCINVLSKTDLDTRIAANGLSTGCKYIITDRADLGIIICASTTSTLELHAEGMYLNADYQGVGDYSGVDPAATNLGIWNTGLTVIAGESVVIWNNLHWLNLTGSVGGPPDNDLVNWFPLPKDITTGYIFTIDFIKYDFENDWVQCREDRTRDNRVFCNSLLQLTTIQDFQWGFDLSINNYISDTNCINISNVPGGVYSNFGFNGQFILNKDTISFYDNKAYNAGVVNSTATDFFGAVADGEDCLASNILAFAKGTNCTASGFNSIAEGTNCTASATGAKAIGTNCISNSSYSRSSGQLCQATGSYAIAEGNQCTASGIAACAFGSACTATGNGAFAAGSGCNAVGGLSQAWGDHSDTTQPLATASGLFGQADIANCDTRGFANPSAIGLNPDSPSHDDRQPLLQAPLIIPVGRLTLDDVASALYPRYIEDGSGNELPGGNLVVPTDHVWSFEFDITAIEKDAAFVARWFGNGMLQNTSGVITYLGNILYQDSAGVWGNVANTQRFPAVPTPLVLSFTSSGGNMIIEVTGIAATFITWLGTVKVNAQIK